MDSDIDLDCATYMAARRALVWKTVEQLTSEKGVTDADCLELVDSIRGYVPNTCRSDALNQRTPAKSKATTAEPPVADAGGDMPRAAYGAPGGWHTDPLTNRFTKRLKINGLCETHAVMEVTTEEIRLVLPEALQDVFENDELRLTLLPNKTDGIGQLSFELTGVDAEEHDPQLLCLLPSVALPEAGQDVFVLTILWEATQKGVSGKLTPGRSVRIGRVPATQLNADWIVHLDWESGEALPGAAVDTGYPERPTLQAAR